MSHVDSPLERKAAAERAAMGQRNAKGVNSMANRANDRDNFAVERVVDKDGDGKISKKEMKNAVAAFGLELNDRETGLLLDEMNLLVAAKGGDKNSISYELFKKVLLQG